MEIAGLRAVVFDLDNTLLDEGKSVSGAFARACALAEEEHGIEPSALEQAVREEARSLWHLAPERDYCVSVGISSWEGLVATFAGEHASLAPLREWSAEYRLGSWSAALRRYDVIDPPLAAEMSELFRRARRAHHPLIPFATECLQSLRDRYALGVVTNGAPDLQSIKLTGSGLRDHFAAVVISGNVGLGKPDRAVFEAVLGELGTRASETVMVGDGPKNDVAGAQEAGLRAIWFNRDGRKQAPRSSGLLPRQRASAT